jgi:hypothetical protein
VDLNTLSDLPPGVALVHALAINDFGWIAATNSSGTACLLIPHKSGKEKRPHRGSLAWLGWLKK